MSRKNRLFAKLANTVNSDGRLQESSLAADLDLGGGTEIYANQADLPLEGVDAGTQAYVAENNRLYMWNGDGWYNISLINTAPTITSGGAGSYTLVVGGSPTIITLAAEDPEGLPITWSYQVTSGTLGNTATVEQADNVFTITPSSNEAHHGEFTIAFIASDGVNISTDINTFTLPAPPPAHYVLNILHDGASYLARGKLYASNMYNSRFGGNYSSFHIRKYSAENIIEFNIASSTRNTHPFTITTLEGEPLPSVVGSGTGLVRIYAAETPEGEYVVGYGNDPKYTTRLTCW